MDARNLEDYIACHQTGIWESLVDLGEEVKEGQLVGRLHNFSDHAATPFDLYAHRSGIVIMMCARAHCQEGTTLYVIAQDAQS